MSTISKWTDAKSLYSSKPYGTVYSTYELPGTRIYRDNETHHGLVTLSDGSRPGKPARLELTTDALTIQIPLSLASWYEEENKETVLGENARIVTLQRLPDSGFGFSIKGGFSGTCRAPIIISKVWRDQENVERVKQLLVGDAIIELNGIPVENKTHDEVVQLLRESSDKLELKVKHQKDVACYLKKMPFGKSQTSMISDLSTAASTLSFQSPTIYSPTEAPKGWKSVARIPLPMAYITRYLRGTDKVRPNAFEVRAVDGSSSGLIYCEDQKIVDQWMQYIMKNIVRLNSKSIKLSNKFLHPDELIVYLGWVCEKIDDVNNNAAVESKEFWQSWEPRFLILKGSEICLFEAPPLNTEDLGKCLTSYRIIETRFKDVKDFERRDEREYVFGVDTARGDKRYFSVEAQASLEQLRAAWHRSIYYTVTRLQSKTFACNVDDRPSGLVFDIKHGIGLYDIHKKKYAWRYKFSMLKSSCDDGKMHVRLAFDNRSTPPETKTVDLDCTELYPLIYSLHSFMLARVISVDQDFIDKNKF